MKKNCCKKIIKIHSKHYEKKIEISEKVEMEKMWSCIKENTII